MEKCFLNGKVFELLPDVEAEAADVDDEADDDDVLAVAVVVEGV